MVYNSFTNFDFGSDLADKSHNNKRTSNAIASSHILSLLYEHWKFAFTLRYFHNGGQWNAGEKVNFGDGPFELKNTGWEPILLLVINFKLGDILDIVT